MLYLSGIVITFFLSIILASKKGKTQSDNLLALWLAFTCLHFTVFYMFVSSAFVHFPYLLGVEIPLPLMYGPFLYLYAGSLTKNLRINSKSLLHFLPALGLYLRLVPFFILSGQEKIYVYQHEGIGYESLIAFNRIAIIVSGITYIILTLLMLRRHRKNIENEFSNTDRINLNWLRYLTYGTSAIWLVIIIGLEDKWIYTTAAFYVFFLGYFGIRQVGIFSNQNLQGVTDESSPENNFDETIGIERDRNDLKSPSTISAEEKLLESDTTAKVKYQKSSLSDDEGRRIHEQLISLMVKKELFKDPELNLGEVAKQLDVHPNILSQVINSFEKKSFYDYINGQRIEEFKKLAVDPDHKQFTLLALAFDCGFNSKTAFNRNFRKSTGLSPSEYLNQRHLVLAD
ncbi:MAG TPA: helix-turn-helix domain-containing protein [Chitinophagales bacterium]|nr:helix-turn-helix domain-containing protein [Chitinophagales bacterium]